MKLMEFNPDLTLKDNHGRLVIFIVIFFICVLDAIVCIDVPLPLINDLWVFLFQKIE